MLKYNFLEVKNDIFKKMSDLPKIYSDIFLEHDIIQNLLLNTN
jgi:hypothetical protein